ncbi:MAG: thioredoxin, partial [Pseudomonadaceae bacterium]|nr:thioredoxin [Pseudomonadaceae bacterium]
YSIDITLENFQQVILEGSLKQPILVDFWADWCAPCKVLMPILEKLANEFQGQFILAKVNIEEQPELAQQFQVRSVPTVILVGEGKLLDQFDGVKPESEIRAFLKQHLTNPVDALKEQVKQHISAGELDEAQEMLQYAISQLPEDINLQIDLARVLLQKNLATDAKAVLENLPEADKARPDVKGLMAGLKFSEAAPSAEKLAELGEREDSEANYLKAMAALLQSDHEQALERLLNLLRDDRSYQEGVAHKRLLEVFAMLGEGNPLVIKARRKLYTLMY